MGRKRLAQHILVPPEATAPSEVLLFITQAKNASSMASVFYASVGCLLSPGVCVCAQFLAAALLWLPSLRGYCCLWKAALLLFTQRSESNQEEHCPEHRGSATRALPCFWKQAERLGSDVRHGMDKGFGDEASLCEREGSKRSTAAFQVPRGRGGIFCHFHFRSSHFAYRKQGQE